MTVNKKPRGNGPIKKDGKKGPADQLQQTKTTAKYTIERSKEDIKNLHETVRILEYYFSGSYNTDAQMYRDLPKLTVKLNDIAQDLRKANETLTAKLRVFEDLKWHICRINEIVGEK